MTTTTPAPPRTCGGCCHLTQGILWSNPWRCHAFNQERPEYIKRDDPRAEMCGKWKAPGG